MKATRPEPMVTGRRELEIAGRGKSKGKGQKFQKQHALKGQKLLAQGIALGIMADNKAPCKGKSFMSCLEL